MCEKFSLQVNSEEEYFSLVDTAKIAPVELTALPTVPVYVPGFHKPVPVPTGTSQKHLLVNVIMALRLSPIYEDLSDMLKLRVNGREVAFFLVTSNS